MVTKAQHEAIDNYRRTLLDTPHGRRTLGSMLSGMGLFRHPADLRKMAKENPAGALESLIQAHILLANLGLIDESNRVALLDKLAEVPAPSFLENERGETT